MIINSRMRALLERNASPPSEQVLPDDAAAIVDAGWTVGPQETLLLAAFASTGPPTDVAPSDIGEYEYHANDVSISLSDLSTDIQSYLADAAARGLQFATMMLRAATPLPHAAGLCAIVSLAVVQHEDFLLQGVTVRFTTRRGGHPDWLGELEAFETEAIAVLEMVDADAPGPLTGERIRSNIDGGEPLPATRSEDP
jgi:hypothetical protein